MARQLVETATSLILTLIQTNIAAQLTVIATARGDGFVSTNPPRTYSIYAPSFAFEAPAVFVMCDNIDFQKEAKSANFITAKMRFNISVVVEDKDSEHLTIKAWRYQAALDKILDQAELVGTSQQNVKDIITVQSATFSPIFTKSGKEPVVFRKEVVLECDVFHYEQL